MNLKCVILGHRTWNSYGSSKLAIKKGSNLENPKILCRVCYECGMKGPFKHVMPRSVSRWISAKKGD